MGKQKEDAPAPGAPAWTATFGDLMNLLLCFFVLLYAMSSVDAAKFEQVAASFSTAFGIFSGGSSSFGTGALIGDGVSQLTELGNYVNSMGLSSEGDTQSNTNASSSAAQEVESQQMAATEAMAENIQKAMEEAKVENDIELNYTSQYVQLTLQGAILFDSGSVDIKKDAYPILDKVGSILETFAGGTIEIEGHTDNVPMANTRKYEDNDVLSMYRALNVANYIRDTTDIDPSHIKSSGRGSYVPVADNSTPEGRAKNRRVEIKIYNSYNSNLD